MMLVTALGVLALASLGATQTYTDCNPTQKKCPPNPGLPYSNYDVDFTRGPDGANWASIGTSGVTYNRSGAGFTVAKQGDSPTLATAWYFFFGRAEVHMRAAPGTGIVSCVVLESDDLDEIDWEFLGGFPAEVQTNYFGKGNITAYDRGGKTVLPDTQWVTRNYTISWTPAAITWYVDSVLVRVLRYNEALGGYNFPQTPARLKLGIWAGGDPSNANGTIQWAGGLTDYGKGPYTMYVERVSVTNAYPAASYVYGDYSGDWRSIIRSSSRVKQQLYVAGPDGAASEKEGAAKTGGSGKAGSGSAASSSVDPSLVGVPSATPSSAGSSSVGSNSVDSVSPEGHAGSSPPENHGSIDNTHPERHVGYGDVERQNFVFVGGGASTERYNWKLYLMYTFMILLV